jgi:hypothetical protein
MAKEHLVNQAAEAVEALCTPEKMPSKADALDFLEDVIARLKSSAEALEEEIENES